MILGSLSVPIVSSSYHNQRQVETEKSKILLIRTSKSTIIT